MEIILDKIKSNILNNVSYTFKNSITFVNGISLKDIKELLFLEKRPINGRVYLSERGLKKDIAYLSNEVNFIKNNLEEEMYYYFKLYKLNYRNIDKKINDSLKMLNLSNIYLKKEFNIMSSNELKLCDFALKMFLNPKIIILDYYDKTLPNNIIEYIKKLVLKLNKMYDKNIIISSNNIELYLNIIKDIVIFNNGDIVFTGDKTSFYDSTLYNYIDEPKIVNFIKYINKKGHKFDSYIDIKELLKAIYRDVENK